MKFARVPQGTSTCGWCYFLASKGACYHGEAAAVAGSHEGCDCEVVAVKDDSELPWNVKWMRSCWADCSDTVGGPLAPKETRALWDALDESERARWRERHGSKAYEKFHERKSVEHICAEVERRDAGWLYRGVEPAITFEDAAWEAEIRRVRPWEIETAERLSAKGFKCDFWRDYEEWAIGGRIKRVGLPDLSDGCELKSLLNPGGKGAVNTAMRDAGHKKGIRCCVIDNSLGKMPDEDVVAEILEHQRGRHLDDVLLIKTDGSVRRFIDREARTGAMKVQVGASKEIIPHSN